MVTLLMLVNFVTFNKYSKKYISRLRSPEWVAVDLLGKILIKDHGTCNPGGYCKTNKDGVCKDSYPRKCTKEISIHPPP